MTSSPALRIADEAIVIERIAQAFHRVGKLLPDRTDFPRIAPDCSALAAVELLRTANLSHLPVLQNDEVLGVFSYKSYALTLEAFESSRSESEGEDEVNLSSLSVQDTMDIVNPQHCVSVKDELHAAIDRIDKHGFALVGFIEKLEGIVTSKDVRDHCYRAARPFVLLEEIEQGIRKLIRQAVREPELTLCVQRANDYKVGVRKDTSRKIRTVLEENVFSHYIYIVEEPENWSQHFRNVFGGMRTFAATRLNRVRRLRNNVFHFKRELTDTEYDTLVEDRDWILMQARNADALAQGAI